MYAGGLPGRQTERVIRHISEPVGAHLGRKDGLFSWAAPVFTVLVVTAAAIRARNSPV
jgi:hypothetical protein